MKILYATTKYSEINRRVVIVLRIKINIGINHFAHWLLTGVCLLSYSVNRKYIVKVRFMIFWSSVFLV